MCSLGRSAAVPVLGPRPVRRGTLRPLDLHLTNPAQPRRHLTGRNLNQPLQN